MANLWFCVRQVVHPALDLWVCCSGVVGCLAEGLLGGVDKVEETILVLLLPEILDVSFPSAFSNLLTCTAQRLAGRPAPELCR